MTFQTTLSTAAAWPYAIPTIAKPKKVYPKHVTKDDAAYGALTEAVKRYVKDHPGAYQAEIREAMGLTANAIASLLSRMTKRGQLYKVKDGHFYRYALSSTVVIGKRQPKQVVNSLPVVDVYEVPTKTKVVIDYLALFERLARGPIVVRAHDISKWMYEALKAGRKISRRQSVALVDGKRTKIWTVEMKGSV